MSAAPRQRVVVMVFDGLRPDMVTPHTMPTLHEFAASGVWYPNARAVFPSETRVNQASLVTGCMPRRHGIVGNKFIHRSLWPERLVNSGDEDHLFALHQALDGQLLDVPSLGEHLASAGRSLAVVGSGTPGGTRILHHRAEQLDQFRLSLYRPDRSTPAALVSQISERFGPIPEQALPAVERLQYAVDVFLDFVVDNVDPDVTIVWSFEPDYSYHYSGLGTAVNLQALRCADEQLARILDWRATLEDPESVHIITLSDHGHLATVGEPLQIAHQMRDAGWRAGAAFGSDTDIVMFCSTAGGCYFNDPTPAPIAAVADWLRNQDWCGPVFADDLPGCFARADVMLDHPRAPQIVFVARSHDAPNDHGLPGRCLHDTRDLAQGGGMHGGLHRAELNNWLALGGGAFRRDTVIETTAGIVDILPTVFAALGLPPPANIDGRTLHESMDPSAAVTARRFAHEMGGYALHTSTVNGTAYLTELLSTKT